VDAALGTIDTLDVMGFGYGASLPLWYRLLNCGIRLPATSGTDCFLNRISGMPPGWGRTYVLAAAAGGELDYEAWTEGQRLGRSFISRGAMLEEFSVAGRSAGGTLELKAPERLRVRARARSQFPLKSLELIWNGEVIAQGEVAEDGRLAALDAEADAAASGWFAVRADGPDAPLNSGGSPAAHANPVWVEVAGRPNPAAPQAARYFLSWIDRLEADLNKRGRIPFGLEAVKAQLESARSFYRRLE
jgi:hypothetical protein